MAAGRVIARALTRYPYLNLAIIAIVTIISLLSFPHLRFDTSLSAFVIRNDPDMIYYDKVKEIFETDETIVIAFKPADLFGRKDLGFIQELTDKISDIDYVRNIRSLTNANLINSTPDMFEVKALVETLPETPEEALAIKEHATTNYIYVKDLSSPDGRFASLLVDIKNDPDAQRTDDVVRDIKDLLANESRNSGYRFYLGGDAIINYSLGRYMQRDFFTFLGPTYLILFLLLLVTVGRKRDILISLSTISLALLWTTGILSIMGKTLNNVTIGIIPLILCIALEDIYYFHNEYYVQLIEHKDKYKAMRETLNNIMAPCFFTSLTTLLGFGSLMINNIKPILDFGLVGGAAVMLAFIATMLFIPSMHILLGMPKDVQKRPRLKFDLTRLMETVTGFVDKRSRIFWILIPLILIWAIAGMTRIKIETDHLSFFRKNSDVYQATTFIEKNLAGISNLEITVDTGNEDAIKQPFVLEEMDRLVDFLRAQPRIDKATSIIDFLKDMNRAMYDNDDSYYTLPASGSAVAQYLLLYSMSSRRNDIEKDFVNYDYSLGRIRCRISEHNSTRILDMVDKIKDFIGVNISPKLQIKITSYPVIYSNMVDSLARGQAGCLVLVFFLLLLSASIYFRSWRTGILSMLPNILPIMITLGFMGWSKISLNVGTAMTAGIAIGLAMDDTTHIFTHFRQNISKDPDFKLETFNTMKRLGEPMVFSSILMMSGYLVLLLSQFKLTALFGMLCALTIFTALLCDLFITPWILMTFRPRFSKR